MSHETWRSARGFASLAFALALGGTFQTAPLTCLAQPSPDAERWLSFEGSWSAAGERQVLPMGGERRASIVHLTGALVLTAEEGLSRGFLSEAIGFYDGGSLTLGSCVWTDDRGDQIFSDLKGESVGTGRRMSGTITGGTGRYAGMSGEYAFEWQYVVQGEEGAMGGRAVGLKGRVRRGQPAAEGPP